MLRPSAAARRNSFNDARDRLGVALRAPSLELFDLGGFGFRRDGEDRVGGVGQRRRFGFDEAVDADHGLLAALDGFQPRSVGFHQLLLHVALLDGGNGAAHRIDGGEFLKRGFF